jgi:hypothetical protein
MPTKPLVPCFGNHPHRAAGEEILLWLRVVTKANFHRPVHGTLNVSVASKDDAAACATTGGVNWYGGIRRGLGKAGSDGIDQVNKPDKPCAVCREEQRRRGT